MAVINLSFFRLQTYGSLFASVLFRLVRSFFQVQLGILDYDVRHCLESENVYGAIVCPTGFFKLSEEIVDSQCSDLASEHKPYFHYAAENDVGRPEKAVHCTHNFEEG